MKCEILQKLDFACNRKLCKCVVAVETERVSQFWRQIQVRRLESFNFDSRIRRMRNFSKKFDFATNSRNPEKFEISEFSGNLIFFFEKSLKIRFCDFLRGRAAGREREREREREKAPARCRLALGQPRLGKGYGVLWEKLNFPRFFVRGPKAKFCAKPEKTKTEKCKICGTV